MAFVLKLGLGLGTAAKRIIAAVWQLYIPSGSDKYIESGGDTYQVKE